MGKRSILGGCRLALEYVLLALLLLCAYWAAPRLFLAWIWMVPFTRIEYPAYILILGSSRYLSMISLLIVWWLLRKQQNSQYLHFGKWALRFFLGSFFLILLINTYLVFTNPAVLERSSFNKPPINILYKDIDQLDKEGKYLIPLNALTSFFGVFVHTPKGTLTFQFSLATPTRPAHTAVWLTWVDGIFVGLWFGFIGWFYIRCARYIGQLSNKRWLSSTQAPLLCKGMATRKIENCGAFLLFIATYLNLPFVEVLNIQTTTGALHTFFYTLILILISYLFLWTYFKLIFYGMIANKLPTCRRLPS